MRGFLLLAAMLAFAVGALGFWAYRSDIQLIIAFVGVFSGAILIGQFAILGKLNSE